MENIFKVAILQLNAINNMDNSLKKDIIACRKAKELGADIAVFPESSRILMIKGAEIILVPNACFMSKIRLEQLKIRAYENMVGIVTVNYTDYGGRSSAFSPIVRDENKKELNSEILIMDENERIQIVEFNMDEIRNYREHGTWGDSYRKPFLYEYIS